MNASMAPLNILMVDDNPADVRLAMEAFKGGTVGKTLHVVKDGVDAMSFLRREGDHHAAPRPDVILLDLNLPRKDGREVLAEVKADPELRRIPTIVLTTSRAETDIVKSYDLHANCYVVKPVDLDKFFDLIRSFEKFWLSSVTLSPK